MKLKESNLVMTGSAVVIKLAQLNYRREILDYVSLSILFLSLLLGSPYVAMHNMALG